jgi:hypothetical protein
MRAWVTVGGTSASAPIIAGVYGLGGQRRGDERELVPPRARRPPFDVTSGTNGACRPSYLCAGGPGYDGPSGLGTPNGTGAF